MPMKTSRDISEVLSSTVESLLVDFGELPLSTCRCEGEPTPSGQVLAEVVQLIRRILFPGYFGESLKYNHALAYRVGMDVDRVYALLIDQIHAGLCQRCDAHSVSERHQLARQLAMDFISYLPTLRRQLAKDVVAAYNGDPAATSFEEVICCYPAIKAVSSYRVAHRLHTLGIPLVPRIITELAHSETGIDIHPGAQIGEYFTIDHGTGVVIGETCIIGSHVKLYQGVTLGAKSFPLDDDGHPIKGIPRHPILEDNVIVYSNATILGRITIGHDAVVGGNIWVTENVPPHAHIVQRK